MVSAMPSPIQFFPARIPNVLVLPGANNLKLIDATFPEYETKVFPKEKPNSSLSLNPELLWKTAKVAAIGDVMTLHLYKDRVLMEAQAKDGTKSRAVLMGCEARAQSVKSKPQEPRTAPAQTPVSAPKAQPVQETGTRAEHGRKPFRKFGSHRRLVLV